MIRYCRKWGWRDFWRDNFTRQIEDERGQVFGPEAFKWKFDPETFRMRDGRTLREWESGKLMSRREQLIQEELQQLMRVPAWRTQKQHRTYLESLITWHPHGQDSQYPLQPKPPLTITTLRMLALTRVIDELLSGPRTPTV
jgi:hypothetical protein